jgi:hypothetical protein
MSEEPDRWCVYRIYAPDTRELLYIGQTNKRKGRVKSHSYNSPWFPCEYWWQAIDRGLITFEEHPTQISTIVAEAWAIEAENPKHNKQRPDWRGLAEWARKRPDLMQIYALRRELKEHAA